MSLFSDDPIANRVISKHEKMRGMRANWDRHWEEVADYFFPNKNSIFIDSKTSGEKKGNLLYNSTPVQANIDLASALHSMLTNPTSTWFGLSTGIPDLDKNVEVKAWLDEAVAKMISVMNNSNFQTEIHETYLDIGSFGTTLLRVLDDEEFVVRFAARPIYESFIAEDYKGNIDTVSYEYKTTLRNVVQEFGEDVLDADTLKNFKDEPMSEVTVIHLVEPREDVDDKKAGPKNLPFASFHVLKSQGVLLKESGFHENPNIVARWSKVSNEIYGRSPAMAALPDAKMVNEMQKVVIQAAQKIIDPPMQVPDDGVMLPIRLQPASVNYYRAGSKDRIEPLFTGSRTDIGEAQIAAVEARIKQAFYIDKLTIREADRMTATEIVQRREEQLRLLGPILGRQNFELLRPLIDRVFGIMSRADMFDAAPDIMQGVPLEVRYTSQMAKAQDTADADQLTRALTLIGPLLQLDPESIDNLDSDFITRDIFNKFLPALYLEKEEFVKKVREEKAQMQQQQAEQEQMQEGLATAQQAQQIQQG